MYFLSSMIVQSSVTLKWQEEKVINNQNFCQQTEIKGSKEPTHGSAYRKSQSILSGTENKKVCYCPDWFYIFLAPLKSQEQACFLSGKIGSWCKTSLLSRILKAYYKNRTPGLNTVMNQKGPLTSVGSSPYCVLLQVVSEDSEFVLFSVHKKNYVIFGVIRICWVLKNRACYFIWDVEFFMHVSFWIYENSSEMSISSKLSWPLPHFSIEFGSTQLYW